MHSDQNKVMDLSTAIRRFVDVGAHISIGGFTINRNPMAAVYEIIRQRITGLHLYAHSNGQGVDELVGAGCVARLEIAYAGSGRFASTCIRFRKAVENRSLAVEDYSNYQMTLRFMAGAMGVPFLPTRSGLGTSIIDKWGFPAERDKPIPRFRITNWSSWTTRSTAGAIPTGSCWYRPSIRMSPSFTFRRPMVRARPASKGLPSPMSSRPKPRDI